MRWIKRKVPFIEQMTQTECGLACIAMVLRYYKSHETLQDLRDCLDTGRDGSSMEQLKGLLTNLGLTTKVYQAEVDQLDLVTLPAIIHYEEKHFVVLESINHKRAKIVDPSSGAVNVPLHEFKEKFSKRVIQAVPNASFKPKKRDRDIWKEISAVIYKERLLFSKIFATSLMLYAFSIGMPMVIQVIIDKAQLGNMNQLNMAFMALAGAVFLNVAILTIKKLYMIKFRVAMDFSVSSKMIEKLLKVSYHFYEMRRKADLLLTINSGYVIREIFAQQLMSGLIDLGAIVFMGVYLYSASPLIFAVSLLLFIINGVYLTWSRPLLADANKQLIHQQGRVQGQQVEMLYAILGIKMAGIEDEVYRVWENNQQEYLKVYSGKEKLENNITILTNLLRIGSPFLILSLCIILMTKGQLTMGGVMALYTMSSTFFGLSGSVSNVYSSYINSIVYLERIQDILAFEQYEQGHKKLEKPIEGNLTLRDVSFSYSKHSKKVVEGIHLDIKAGQKVAIVGKSGSGKSTLAKLLIGLYHPSSGEVLIDGHSLRYIDTSELRQQMGIVPQDVTLFNRSLSYNIGMDREDVTQEDIERAAKLARIHDEIEAMPMKYNTLVSEMGTNLSGGQRQRIVLARSIVKTPKVLVLDEATSALDGYNEKLISEHFAKEGCTRIIIAHRLSTIQDADFIVVMDQGKIAETGTHEALIELGGKYCELYSSGLGKKIQKSA